MRRNDTAAVTWATWLGLLALVARPAWGDLLTNPGFETDGLSGWTTFGQNWRTGSGADAHAGAVGAVNDTLTSDTDEWRGIYQNVPVIPDNFYQGGVWIRSLSVDTTESWFELQFLNNAGTVLSQQASSHVDADQAFTFMGISPVLAPAGAVTASVRAVVQMPSVPGDSDFHIFDDFEFSNATPTHVAIQNHGFESGDFTSWTQFGQGWRIGTGEDAFSYTYGAVNDTLTSDSDEWRGVYQNLPVTEGLTYCAGVYIRAVSVDTTRSWLELQWLNSSGGVISQSTSANVTNDQAFLLTSLHDQVAPAGAVTASVRCIVHRLSVPPDSDFHIFDEAYFLRPVDLSVSITASTTNVVGPNEEITYTLTVSNHSASMSGSYFVTNDLTTNLTFVSASSGGVNNGSLVTWAHFGIPGHSATTLTVTALQPLYNGSTQQFDHAISAWVASGIGDPIPGNDAATTQTKVWGIPMLTTLAMILLAVGVAYAYYRRNRIPRGAQT